MLKTIVTVLRSGGEFRPEHVIALQRQVEQWTPEGTKFVCLTDTNVPGVECTPLEHYWPGWWAKMELFRPGLEWDLYTDLDNVILGPLDDILEVRGVVLNSGVNDTAWTSLMAVPQKLRARVWDTFNLAPRTLMNFYDAPEARPPFGDAAIVAMNHREQAARWEEVLPGQIVNISTMMTPFGFRLLRPKPRVVLCHRPHRPWTIPIFKRLYEETP